MTLDAEEFSPCKQCKQPMRITDARCEWCGVAQPGTHVDGPASKTAARSLMVASFAAGSVLYQYMAALRMVDGMPVALAIKLATAVLSITLIVWALRLARKGFAETADSRVSGRGQATVARYGAYVLLVAWAVAVVLGILT